MTQPPVPPASDAVRAAGDVLRSAGYDAARVADLLGPSTPVHLDAGDPVPARRRLRDAGHLGALTRLLLLGDPVEDLPDHLAVPLLAAGLASVDGSTLTAPLVVEPHETGLVAADRDLPAGTPMPADHVLGPGPASDTLRAAAVRRRTGRALDLGTGSGVLALQLGGHAQSVVATDSVPRATAMASLTAALSGATVDVRLGDLTAPVARESFDQVLCNPPFVISPEQRYAFRDGTASAAGDLDEGSRRLVRALPGVLAPGGVAQLLTSWVVRAGEDWRERVGGWFAGTGCDAWVVCREVADPEEYALTWLAHGTDAATDPDRLDAWLAAYTGAGVEALGFGVVALRRTDRPAPRVVVEELRAPFGGPWGEEVAATLERADALDAYEDDAVLLAARLRVAPDVRLDTVSEPSDEGWRPETTRLVRTGAVPRSATVDTYGAAVVVGCDGTRPLSALLTVLAAATGLPTGEVVSGSLPQVRGLVEDGYLLPG